MLLLYHWMSSTINIFLRDGSHLGTLYFCYFWITVVTKCIFAHPGIDSLSLLSSRKLTFNASQRMPVMLLIIVAGTLPPREYLLCSRCPVVCIHIFYNLYTHIFYIIPSVVVFFNHICSLEVPSIKHFPSFWEVSAYAISIFSAYVFTCVMWNTAFKN